MAVTVPSEFVKCMGIKAGDEVRSEVKFDKGEITYFFSGAKQLPLSENFLKIKRKK